MFLIQLSSFNPAGLQAACANVHSPCTTVDFTFNASDVGIPDTVGSSMGMAYVVTEMSALSTNCTFCHSFAPPCNSLSLPVLSDSQHVYSNRFIFILQANFKKNIKNSKQD